MPVRFSGLFGFHALAQDYVLVILVIWVNRRSNRNEKASWTVAEAKAKLSQVIDQAQSEGPQTITRHGRSAVVLVSLEKRERKTKRVGNLAEFFAAFPLRGSNLVLDRFPEKPREIEL